MERLFLDWRSAAKYLGQLRETRVQRIKVFTRLIKNSADCVTGLNILLGSSGMTRISS